MSKVIRTQKPSVLPWYAAALVFAVLCAALPAYKLWALLLALGGAAVMFGVAKKVCPPRVVEHEVPFHTGSGDVDEMLADIQQKLEYGSKNILRAAHQQYLPEVAGGANPQQTLDKLVEESYQKLLNYKQ